MSHLDSVLRVSGVADVTLIGPTRSDDGCECQEKATTGVCLPSYSGSVRLRIVLDDDIVAEIDRRRGPAQRSAFIGELIQRGLDNERRWEDIEAALGGLPDAGHDWDDDPAAWVRRQRHAEPRGAG